MNSQTKGDTAELRVAAELRSYGYTVLIPFSENEKYDLVVDTGDALKRVQVKHAPHVDGSIVVRCYTSNSSKTGNNRTIYKEEEIDGIAAYCTETNDYFWIPFDEMNKYSFTLSPDGEHQFDDFRLDTIE